MKHFFSAIAPTALVTGLAVLATAAGCDLAVAADLPLITKAAPLAPADPGQFWLGMDYLAWSVKGDRLPALVTTAASAAAVRYVIVAGPGI